MASDIENLILKGTPIPRSEQVSYSDDDLYWRMHLEGRIRFGSECRHEHVSNSTCRRCLRKLVSD